MLNKPSFYYYTSVELWWNRFNKAWLERAVNRGYDVYLATFHTNKIDVLNDAGIPKGAFGYELRYLVQRGYSPLISMKSMLMY